MRLLHCKKVAPRDMQKIMNATFLASEPQHSHGGVRAGPSIKPGGPPSWPSAFVAKRHHDRQRASREATTDRRPLVCRPTSLHRLLESPVPVWGTLHHPRTTSPWPLLSQGVNVGAWRGAPLPRSYRSRGSGRR